MYSKSTLKDGCHSYPLNLGLSMGPVNVGTTVANFSTRTTADGRLSTRRPAGPARLDPLRGRLVDRPLVVAGQGPVVDQPEQRGHLGLGVLDVQGLPILVDLDRDEGVQVAQAAGDVELE